MSKAQEILKIAESRPRSRRRDDDESEWGLTDDGWNAGDLDEVGLIAWIEEIEEVAYELRGARRNSYARFGDTIKALASRVEELCDDGLTIAKDLKNIGQARR